MLKRNLLRTHQKAFVRLLLAEMEEAIITLLSAIGRRKQNSNQEKWWPLTWASKRWQLASMNRIVSTTLEASKEVNGITNNWIESAPSATSVKRSHAAISI